MGPRHSALTVWFLLVALLALSIKSPIAAPKTPLPASIVHSDTVTSLIREHPNHADVNIDHIDSSTVQSSSTAFVRLEPIAIMSDGSEDARLEVFGGSNVVSATLSLTGPLAIGAASGCSGPTAVAFHDDGTHGDQQAADKVFTIGNISWRAELEAPGCGALDTYVVGAKTVYVGDIVLYYTDGSQYTFPQSAYSLIVLSASVFDQFDPVVQLSGEAQHSSHVINIVDNEYRAEGILGQWGSNSDILPLTRRLYAYIPDRFDFVNLVSTVFTACSGCFGGVHLNAKVSWLGTGQSLYDGSADFGSHGQLQGISVLAPRYIDSPRTFLHELLHQWASFLDPSLGLTRNHHWVWYSSLGSLLGCCRWSQNAAGVFESQGYYFRTAAPLELYLMGLVDKSEVSPVYWSENTDQFFCWEGQVITGPFHQVVVDDIIARHGIRTPGPDSAQKTFHMAYVVTTQDRLMTPAEMTYFNHVARLIEGSLQAQSIYWDSYLTFDEYTGGRASLFTGLGTIPPPKLVYLPLISR